MLTHPTPVGNPCRTRLHNERIPDGDLTPRQRAIADAVRFCNSLSDFTAAPEEIKTTIHVATIPYGTNPEIARRILMRGIAKAHRDLDHMERTLHTYGPGPFSPKPEGVRTRGLDAPDRAGIVRNVLHWLSASKYVLIRAGDSPVTRDASRAYVVGERP